MKNRLKTLSALFILAAVLLISQRAMAQPAFTSPATCIPADPNQPATTYTLVAGAGNTITAIVALGDLQITGITPALPATGTITITAKSFNKGRNIKNDCIGYLAQSNSQNFGFGKGVIRVNYTTGANCGLTLDQNINKSFSQTPPIIGPACIAPGDTATYSVCPVLSVNPTDKIGQDVYIWNTPVQGLTEVYRSGDGSSVTFVANDGVVNNPIYTGAILTCKFGACNSGRSSLTLGVKTQPSTVKINSAVVLVNSSTCISTASTPINLVATNSNGYTYTWSSNNSSWSFTAGGTTAATINSISNQTIQLNANESNGAIYLKTTGGCNVRIDTFYINRTLAAPLTIKRLDNATCITSGSAITFTINNATNTANFGNLAYTWTLPAGWSYNAGTSQTASTIYTTSGAAGGTVTAKVTGCPTGVLSNTVNVKPATPTGWVGNTCYPQGSTAPQSYSVTNASPLTYVWTNSGTGWTGSSTTSGITYTPTASAVPGTITVSASNGACSSDPLTKTISYAPLAPTNIINTGIYPGGACTTTLTATGGQGSSYTWTIPPAFGTISGPATGSSIVVNTTGTTGVPYTISVVANNVCGSSGSFSKNITVSAPSINYNTTDPSYDVLSLIGASGLTYCWRLNNAGGCVFNTQSILLQNGSAASYTVDITYPCGQHYFITQATRYSSRSAVGIKNSMLTLKDVVISPNPAKGAFNLALPATMNSAHLRVYNSKGSLIQQMTCAGGINNINTEGWSNGEYILKITGGKGGQISKKIIVNK